ncbi:hypothetical protein YT03_000349 [Salmonella enterica subsp. enterica]|nr:hypothetical protein [Salmonella enterica subsp. enterica serovar Sandiego]
MSYMNQRQSEEFWAEVIHRSRSQLCDMNVGVFHQWEKIVGNKEVHRLLNLMELLLSTENHKFEIEFVINWINCRTHGSLLFKSFGASGKTFINKGMNGEIYCIPVLYVIIRSLMDKQIDSSSLDYEKNWGIDISKLLEQKFAYQKPRPFGGFVT